MNETKCQDPFFRLFGSSETGAAAALSLGRGGTHGRGANIDIRFKVSRLKHWENTTIGIKSIKHAAGKGRLAAEKPDG